MKRTLFLLMAPLLLAFALAQQPSPTNTPKLKEISPGVFEYNGIQLDKTRGSISFAGKVNQREGLIEYLLVNEKGKTHESLLSTTLAPHDIHAAMLLIGLKPTSSSTHDNVPPDAIDSAYLHSAGKLAGEAVDITVSWTQDGKSSEVPVETWVFNLSKTKPMTLGPWTYNGSMIDHGVFLADQEFSLISVITDPTALVNNPRDGYDDDTIWQPNTEKIPPLDTPVQIKITLPATLEKP